MKRFTVLLSFLILISPICSFNLVSAVDFEVQLEPGKTFIHPDDMNTYAMGSTDVYIDIKMGNNSGADIFGFVQTLRFYSTNGNGTTIVWSDEGFTPESSIERLNGWEDATYWNYINEINTFSWDGSLPDTMNHTTTGDIAWPDGDPTTSHLRFHFMVPVPGHDPLTDIVEICVDQSDAPDPTYDWLFPDGSQFGGPYCFEFLGVIVVPPVVETPQSIETYHDTPFDVVFDIDFAEEPPLTGVCAYDENDNPIGVVSLYVWHQLHWFFIPPCDWANDELTHTVTFHAECATAGLLCPMTPGSTVELIVNERLPVIRDKYREDLLVRVEETEIITFELLHYGIYDEAWSYQVNPNPEGPSNILNSGIFSFTPTANDEWGEYVFTIRATNCLGSYDENELEIWVRTEILCGDPNSDFEINILDIVFMINGIYKDGPGPGPIEISDVNDDESVDILDIVGMINAIYKAGPALNCPAWE
ncbi:MAG: hypothetical protein GY865_01320 [candidate division Zixibacteria bacterium]|nr:hypothetical protein [candidate division Zixibacteria bacterium]